MDNTESRRREALKQALASAALEGEHLGPEVLVWFEPYLKGQESLEERIARVTAQYAAYASDLPKR